jgi:D-3-phosphoglycerate dehydrogenase
MNIAILSTLWPASLEQLEREHSCHVAINPPSEVKLQLLADAEIVIVRSPVQLDRAAIEAAARLKLIIRAGAGLDAIDIPCAKRRGVTVIAVPLSADSVAELALGLMLAVCRRIPVLDQSLRQGRWEKHSRLGIELAGKTLGLVGFGRIGRRTAEIANALGMQLLAFDRSPRKHPKPEFAQRLSVRFMGLDSLFGQADIVSIQIPLDDTTRHLISARQLALMKPDGVLVNLGRGGTVDEQALYEALRLGRLGGAGLDVYETEPTGENRLFALDNVVATPHVGAQTFDAQWRVGEDVVGIVQAFSAGRSISELGVLA